MENKLLENIVKKSNTAYLKEISSCLNYVFGCVLEKVIYSAIFVEKYKDFSNFIDPRVIELVDEIKLLNDNQKMYLIIIFSYLSNTNDNRKYNTVYFTVNVVNHKDNKELDYLYLMFNYSSLIDKLKCIINIKEEDMVIIRNILNKLIRIVFCHDQDYIDNKPNRLKGYVHVDNVVLISNNNIDVIEKEDFSDNYIRSLGIELDQDKCILPIVECFENSVLRFNLKLF